MRRARRAEQRFDAESGSGSRAGVRVSRRSERHGSAGEAGQEQAGQKGHHLAARPVQPVTQPPGRRRRRFGRLPFVPLSPSQEAAVVEHVFRVRVQRPVVAFTGIPGLPGDLDEAVVE